MSFCSSNSPSSLAPVLKFCNYNFQTIYSQLGQLHVIYTHKWQTTSVHCYIRNYRNKVTSSTSQLLTTSTREMKQLLDQQQGSYKLLSQLSLLGITKKPKTSHHWIDGLKVSLRVPSSGMTSEMDCRVVASDKPCSLAKKRIN